MTCSMLPDVDVIDTDVDVIDNPQGDRLMSLAEQLKLEGESFSFESEITSITQNPEGTQVNATGNVGRYGKVWLTYNFTPNPIQKNMGSFVGTGRAITEERGLK